MTQIQISGLSKAYGPQPVLHDIDLTIEPGEFVALVGPSGCGKSTLLRAIAGLEQTDRGRIHFGTREVTHLPAQTREVAMVFQSYALYPHMTVYDNLAFGPRQRKEPEAQVRQRIDKAARTLQLGDYLKRYPRQLSGGQRQRVAMGRALVREPRAFLFDEPLSNLDAQLRVEMRAEIRLLQRELGTTTVYVTHDQEEAMTMADRVVVLRGGRIEQVGAPLTLYDAPANEFVARFVGSPPMNLLRARLQPGRLQLGPELHVPLPAGVPGQSDDGRWLHLGVRPEHFTLATGDADAALPSLPLRVLSIDHLGSQTELHGQVVGAYDEHRILARLPGRLSVAVGDVVPLSWAPQVQHLFDLDSGVSLAAPLLV